MCELSPIEELRMRLNDLAAEKNFYMLDPEVISLSVKLDVLIVNFQKAQQRACCWQQGSDKLLVRKA